MLKPKGSSADCIKAERDVPRPLTLARPDFDRIKTFNLQIKFEEEKGAAIDFVTFLEG